MLNALFQLHAWLKTELLHVYAAGASLDKVSLWKNTVIKYATYLHFKDTKATSLTYFPDKQKNPVPNCCLSMYFIVIALDP